MAKNLTLNLLTVQEAEVLQEIMSSWDKFLQLPTLHPDEQNEFRTLIHHMQRMILSRPYLRAQIKVQREQDA